MVSLRFFPRYHRYHRGRRSLRRSGRSAGIIGKAAKGEHPRVTICGEGTSTLCEQGKAETAVQLEYLWDELAKTCNVDILCGYVSQTFQREGQGHLYERLCVEHSAVYSR